MERRLLKSAALIAVSVVASACAPGKIGPGCSPTDRPNDRPRAATSPDHTDGKPGDEPNAVDKGTDTARPGAGAKPERPWAHNTGPSDPGALVPVRSFTVTTNGAMYEDIEVTGGIKIDADNVTVRNFRVHGTSHYAVKIVDGHKGIVLEDGEITGATSAALFGAGFTATRLYIHDTGSDAIKAQGASATGPTVIEYSFIERMQCPSTGHVDAIQSHGGHDLTIRYNNFDIPIDQGCGSNSAVIIQDHVTNVLIENNWLNGGNYTIYCQNAGVDPEVSVVGNKFGRDYRYGLMQGECVEWSGNTWEDTGDPI